MVVRDGGRWWMSWTVPANVDDSQTRRANFLPEYFRAVSASHAEEVRAVRGGSRSMHAHPLVRLAGRGAGAYCTVSYGYYTVRSTVGILALGPALAGSWFCRCAKDSTGARC